MVTQEKSARKMKKAKTKRLKVVYESEWSTASPEQRKEFARRLDRIYDLLFRKVVFGKNGRELSSEPPTST